MARILVLTSTFPASEQDSRPAFVSTLCSHIAQTHEIFVLTQHLPQTATRETLDGMEVHRYRYLPERWETLGVGGAILPSLRRHPWKWLAVPFLVTAQILAAARLIRRERIELVHAHWILPQALCAVCARWLASSRAPIVCSSLGGDIFGIRGRLGTRLLRWILARIQVFTGVSNAIVERAESLGVAPDIAHTIAMGVDTKERFLHSQRAHEARTGGFKILFVGRLSEKKGADTLIRAMRSVARDIPEVRLDIIGDGEDAEQLRRLAQEQAPQAAISFLGGLPPGKLAVHYGAADCMVLPSRVARSGDQEGLPVAMLEAMACGCPIIASDLPGIRDAIRDQVTGILVPPDDVEALARTIVRLCKDRGLAARLSRQGREFVATWFDWSVIVSRYLLIYDELLHAQSESSATDKTR